MNDYIIQAKHISKVLKGRTVLKDITASFERGQFYGIIGSNASGKSMLFRALAGLIVLDEGEIIYNPPEKHIGVIIENPGFLLSYTGYENLRILASIKREIGHLEIIEAMEAVGLNTLDKRKVKAYSLGMKQKLAIAQAIMERPDILILDEPTRGLDEKSVGIIRSLLQRINLEGTTILMSSHNADDISILCSHIYTMHEGMLLE